MRSQPARQAHVLRAEPAPAGAQELTQLISHDIQSGIAAEHRRDRGTTASYALILVLAGAVLLASVIADRGGLVRQ